MEFYLLNINRNGKPQVDYWIRQRKIAPVFYGPSTLEQIRSDREHGIKPVAYRDAKFFVDLFSNLHDENDHVIVSIGDDEVYFYRQAEVIREIEQLDADLVKGFAIEIIKSVEIKDCPLVLTTAKSNQYLSRGTFKSLSGELYQGNVNAITFLLDGLPVKVASFDHYLQCLSSLEFETLVAKILEEQGWFVPAYKGGYIRNSDLFCRNVSDEVISIGHLSVLPSESVSIQIKLRLKKAHIGTSDIYYCIWSDVGKPNVFDSREIKTQIADCPATVKWLRETLRWVEQV